MNIYTLIFNLAGAVALLIWAVRTVRTGMERTQEPRIKRLLSQGSGNRFRAAGIGASLAIALQSSTAVCLLTAGLVANQTFTTATGIAIILGADLGSAIVVQILSIDLHWLVPLLLIVGTTAFLRASKRNTKQAGRMLIGIALLLISLQMIGEATSPLRESELLPLVVGYLEKDLVSTFLLGLIFTWLIHSSIASVLLVSAVAAQAGLPSEVFVPLILGANVGGALIAFGLTRSSSSASRQVVLGNLILRGGLACASIAVFAQLTPDLSLLGANSARQVINLHLAFNLFLLLTGLPLLGIAAGLASKLVKADVKGQTLSDRLSTAPSRLDDEAIENPSMALANATQELLGMAENVERMLQPLMNVYETGDREMIKRTRLIEDAVDRAQSEIKMYLARISFEAASDDEVRLGHDLASFAINLEYAGDAISKTMLKLAEVRRDKSLTFSAEGWKELNALHASVLENLRLSVNVLISKDQSAARGLINCKRQINRESRKSYRNHLTRLQHGKQSSIDTSDIHLETLRTLSSINSFISTIGYSVLDGASTTHQK